MFSLRRCILSSFSVLRPVKLGSIYTVARLMYNVISMAAGGVFFIFSFLISSNALVTINSRFQFNARHLSAKGRTVIQRYLLLNTLASEYYLMVEMEESGKYRNNNTFCCVPQCSNRACKNPSLSFHQFPTINKAWPNDKINRNYKRRLEWIRVLRIGKEVTNTMKICSAHFEETDFIFPNVPTKRPHLKNIAIPSLHLPLLSTETMEKRMEIKKKITARKERYAVLNRKKDHCDLHSNEYDQLKTDDFDKTAEVERSALEEKEEDINVITCADALVLLSQATNRKVNLSPQVIFSEEKGVQVCSGDLATNVLLRVDRLDNKQLNSLTGIPSRTLLENLTKHVGSIIKISAKHILSLQEKIILTLMKIKLNLSFVVLAILFGCTSTTCSSNFCEIVRALAAVLQAAVYWPNKEEVTGNMPKCFKNFPNVRVVIDCTEIPVEKPQCLQCRIMTYSHYKGKHTIKFMVCVTPAGLISFISRCYGGRASDKLIFEQSGVVQMLEPYLDKVMVDKGFQINEECDNNGISVIRPPFLQEKKQLSTRDALLTREIASARVHVERVIQRMKIFKMLQTGNFPWNFSGLANDIIIIVAGLTNLGLPVLSDDKFL